jgi:hypothetical protein
MVNCKLLITIGKVRDCVKIANRKSEIENYFVRGLLFGERIYRRTRQACNDENLIVFGGYSCVFSY